MSLDEIKMLTVSERIVLVEEIWDTIEQEQNSLLLSKDEKAILDERLASLDNSPQDTLSWDEIKRKLRS
ncbi:MAG: addiction module protein [Campylobacterota bacterium]|nr:addiction module protein [Campylobacterota bacterium]